MSAKKITEIARRLRAMYPDTRTALTHDSPLQLLVATILSAQCTDVRVNMVTPALFARFPTAAAFACADAAELERLIHSTGFYKNKARNIIGCCRALLENFGGEVPQRLDDLVTLPGVGRKTANVVLGACWNIPGMVVDTHVKRLSNLLGLTKNSDPEKIEQDLMRQLPQEDWNHFGMDLILHGRAVCIARRPKCAQCQLADLCPSARVRA